VVDDPATKVSGYGDCDQAGHGWERSSCHLCSSPCRSGGRLPGLTIPPSLLGRADEIIQ
jgi:hypothetical protein